MLRYTKMRPKERRAVTTPAATAAVSRTVAALAPLNDSTASSVGKRYVEMSRSALNDEERFVVVCNGTVLRATNLSPPPERKRCGALYDFISVESARSRPVDGRREEPELIRNRGGGGDRIVGENVDVRSKTESVELKQPVAGQRQKGSNDRLKTEVSGGCVGQNSASDCELQTSTGRQSPPATSGGECRLDDSAFSKGCGDTHPTKEHDKHHLQKDSDKRHPQKDSDKHHLQKDSDKHHLQKDSDKHHPQKDSDKHHPQKDSDKHHPQKDSDKHHLPKDFDKRHLPKGYDEPHFPKYSDKRYLSKGYEARYLPEDFDKHPIPKEVDKTHLPKDYDKRHLPKDVDKRHLPKDVDKPHRPTDYDKDYDKHHLPKDYDKHHLPRDAYKRHLLKDADKRHPLQDSYERSPSNDADKYPIPKGYEEHRLQKDSNKRHPPRNYYKLPSPMCLGERHRLEQDGEKLSPVDYKIVPQSTAAAAAAKGTRVSGGEAQTRVAGGGFRKETVADVGCGFRKETVAGGSQLRDGSRKELSSSPTSPSGETIAPQPCDREELSCDRRGASTTAAAITTTISVSAVAAISTATTTTTNEYREPADLELETCGVLRRSRRRETLDRESKTCDHPGGRWPREEETNIDGQKTPARCWEAGSGQNPFEWRRWETLRGELKTASVGISHVRRQEVRREAAVDNDELKVFDRGPDSTSCELPTSPIVSGQKVSAIDAHEKVRETEFRDLEPVKSLEATRNESEDEEPRTDYVSWQSKNEPWSLYLSKTATKLAFCAHQKRKWLHFFDELDSPRERFAYAVRMFQKRSGSRELLLPPRYRDEIAGDEEDDYEYGYQDYGECREDEYEVEEPASPASPRKPVVERFVAAASTASASSTSFCSAIRKRWTTKIQNNARKLCSNVKSTLTDANSKAPWRAFRGGPRTKLTTNSYRIYGTNEASLPNPNDSQIGLWQTVEDYSVDDYDDDGGETEHYRGRCDQEQLDVVRRCSLTASMVDNIVALEQNVTTSSMTTMTTTTKRVIQASLV